MIKGSNVRMVPRRGFSAMAPQTPEHLAKLQENLSDFSGTLKLYMSSCNNATYLVMGNAFDQLRKTKMWRTKFHKAKGKFQAAIKAWHEYEYQLLHAKENRMFHLANYSQEVRKKYGNISDEEYYDYWCTIGAFAYKFSQDEINSLRWKYKKVLDSYGVQDESVLYADAMVTQIMLNLCIEMLDVHLTDGVDFVGLSKTSLWFFFKDLSLKKVQRIWNEALTLALPEFMAADLNEVENRNIEMGIEQLANRLVDEKMLYHAYNDATDDYQEIFRTKGEWKKALRQIRETRKELS